MIRRREKQKQWAKTLASGGSFQVLSRVFAHTDEVMCTSLFKFPHIAPPPHTFSRAWGLKSGDAIDAYFDS